MADTPRFQAIGECIYCGSDGEGKLSDEHIVPFALGGMIVLPKASCAKCAKITSDFERRCARKMYGNFRIRHKVQTRRKKKRPTAIAAIAHYGDYEKHIMMPVDGAVITFPKVKFKPPGFFRNPQERNGWWVGTELSVETFGALNNASWKEHAADKYTYNQEFDVDALALTLAKIAHALAVAELGMDFFEPWLPPYILGEDKDLAYLVGHADYPEEAKHKLHDVSWHVGPYTDPLMVTHFFVTVRIKLFAQLPGPHALVIVGRTNRAAVEARIAESPGKPFSGDFTITAG